MVAAPTSRRERARAATIEEIKQTALSLMREQGTTDVRFTDIARVMGMTPPALYRYFADRDELLTALITESFAELGSRIAVAQQDVPRTDIGRRWLAGATAYRTWAASEPEQFALVLGTPVPGYVAPEEGPTTEAAQAAMNQLAGIVVDAATQGKLRKPIIRDAGPAMVDCANVKHPELDGVVPPENFQAMMNAWACLHGFAHLEAYGHLDWMGPQARDALFASQVQLAAKAAGLPAPS